MGERRDLEDEFVNLYRFNRGTNEGLDSRAVREWPDAYLGRAVAHERRRAREHGGRAYEGGRYV